MDWLKTTIDSITGVITRPLEEWQRRKTLKVEQEDKAREREHELKLKQLDINKELANQGIKAEIDWDARAQEDMKTSWKDEYLLILWSIPLIMCFIPDLQDYAKKGFDNMKEAPEWYMILWAGMVAGTWGLRWLISRSNKIIK